MGVLATAPGVTMGVTRIYVTAEDVMVLLGCKENKAYEQIREVNRHAMEKGLMSFPSGKANKYLFSELQGIPIEDVNAVISRE